MIILLLDNKMLIFLQVNHLVCMKTSQAELMMIFTVI